MYVLQKQVRTKSCFEIFPRRAHSSLPHKLKKISSVAMFELSLTSRSTWTKFNTITATVSAAKVGTVPCNACEIFFSYLCFLTG